VGRSGSRPGRRPSVRELVIRALVLGEVRVIDWWRVASRGVASAPALATLVDATGA
jgi:hypothetical protein